MVNSDNAFIIQRFKINHIPFLTLYKKSTIQTKMPVIFLFHCLLQNKEHELPFAYMLAQHNYYVVLMDIRGHGEWNDSFDQDNRYDFSCILHHSYQTALDADIVYNYITDHFGDILLNEHVTFIGISLGAHVSVIAGYLYQYVQGVVSVIGSLDWKNGMLDERFRTLRMFKVKDKLYSEQEISHFIEMYHPIHRYNEMMTLPEILFINGSLDTVMPILEVQPYHDQLKDVYIQKGYPDRFQTCIHYKNGHQLTHKMMKGIVSWCEEIYKNEKLLMRC